MRDRERNMKRGRGREWKEEGKGKEEGEGKEEGKEEGD